MGKSGNHFGAERWVWLFYFLGVTYIVLAIGRAVYIVPGSESLLVGVMDFLLVGAPGAMLFYGGYRLHQTDIDPRTYLRIAIWCLGGFSITLGIVELLRFEPGVTIHYPRWTLTLPTPLGTLGGFLIGVYDARSVTQAQQVQQQRQQLRQHKEELHQQSEELQRQNARLDNFASLLAHELRNPLSIARIYLQQAVKGDRDASEEVEKALTRIGEMVEVILVIARGENANINRKEVALTSIAEEAWADLEVPNADLVVETNQTIFADPIHLRHLLENLLTNAVEHANESVTVRVGKLPSGFYIEDNGPGIPEDEREQIFDAGYTTGGTGFGLVFVAELAETYNWNYTVTESESGGARFEFTDIDRTSLKQTRKH